MIQCTSCNRIVFDTTTDGGYKIRSRMLFIYEDHAYALCPSCKHKVPVPLQVSVVPAPKTKTSHIIF